MAEIMEQQLQNLYTVYYQKYDGALLYHDGLYDVRRAYFTSGGKRQKNKVVKEADGVSYRYSYLMERGQPLKWKKLEGFRQVEISEPDAAGGYHILTQDETKRLSKSLITTGTIFGSGRIIILPACGSSPWRYWSQEKTAFFCSVS